MLTPSTGMRPARAVIPTDPQEGAVATQAHQEVGPVHRGRTVRVEGEDRLMAPGGQPRRGPLGQGGRLRTERVGIERDDRHSPASPPPRPVGLRPTPGPADRWGTRPVRVGPRLAGPVPGASAWRRNSMLPASPVIGDGMAPMMSAPEAPSAAATSQSVRRWTSGSRITPRSSCLLRPPRLELGLDQEDHGRTGPGHFTDQYGHHPASAR